MKYGVHRLTWGKAFHPDDLKTFFRQVKETGAETVEFRPPDEALNGDRQKTAEIRRMAEDAGVQLLFCYGYPAGVDMRSPDPFIRGFAQEHLKRAVEAAHYLGGTEIGGVLYSTWPASYEHDMITPSVKYERTQRSLECIRGVIPTAEDYNIQLNFEVLNRFENYIINTVEEGLAFLKCLESSRCGLVLDVFHMNVEEDDLLGAIRSAKGHIGQFHATEPNRGIPFHNTRINWSEIGGGLREIGYDGTVTMEAVVAFDDEASYNLRMWRNLLPDASMEMRIRAMRDGISFLKRQFGDA